MNRIDTCFAQLGAKKALIPFITAGDPHPAQSVELMHVLVEGGADIIELGIPFSDPMADGPVIQRASERALAHGVTLRDVLGMVAQFRCDNQETPVVLMGYLNPIETMGYAVFANAASQAGVDGVLIVDCPPEESVECAAELRAVGLAQIFLLSPTTTAARVAAVAQLAQGYVYYVSLKGVTGAATLNVDEVATRVAELRTQIALPIGVGFGIRDAETARRIAAVADAVVVGSRLVQTLEEASADTAASALRTVMLTLRAGIDAA